MSIVNAIEALKKGKAVILVDDEDRENEGDLVVAAQNVTPEAIHFMTQHGRGLVCLSLASEICDRLNLSPMAVKNESRFGTAFTVSIEAKTGVTTGVSAFDRARTIQVAADPQSRPSDLVSPGHVFPLCAQNWGVFIRRGQTEGSVDLARLAGLEPAAVICEILKEDGHMARLPELKALSEKFDLPLIHIQEIVTYRMKHECLVQEVASAQFPTQGYGDFKILGFQCLFDGSEYLVLVKGQIESSEEVPLVRIHSECITGDTLYSARCDCGLQLEKTLELLSKSKIGVLIYLKNQEGRGIGLLNKIRAYELQDRGLDTVEANEQLGFKPDLRHYGIAAQILKALKMNTVKLLTNNPQKVSHLCELGVHVQERISLELASIPTNRIYLKTKKKKLGHFLSV